MPEQPLFSREELLRQARQHLLSLRETGLEWLPLAPREAVVARSLAEPEKRDLAHPQATPSTVTAPLPATAVESQDPLPSGLFLSAESPELTLEQRRVALDVLREQVAGCSRCAELVSTRTQTVFGEGPLDAELCFIGEAPGFNEDQKGRPFVGEAGQLLDKIIGACGYTREQVYICNILRCRPPGNRTPLVTEAQHCREYLEKQLELIQPKYICALGACAAQNLLGRSEGIGRLRRRFHDYKGIPVLCTYHPAYLLRSPEKKREVWDDMKLLLAKMGKPVPKK